MINNVYFCMRGGGGDLLYDHLQLQKNVDFHNLYINHIISKFDEWKYIGLLCEFTKCSKCLREMLYTCHVKDLKCSKCPLYWHYFMVFYNTNMNITSISVEGLSLEGW